MAPYHRGVPVTLSMQQCRDFRDQGYLVVEGAIGPERLAQVRTEYAQLMDRLYAGWEAEGRLPPGSGLDFWQKLSTAYAKGCDWYQPMDCSLPGGQIALNTPMHIGQATFDMVTDPDLLDIVEALIGPEITSNPIQHIRIKPPQPEVHKTEVRSQISVTDWHQDRGVTLASADETRMITVWLAITDVTLDNAPLQVIPRAHRDGLIEHCGWTQTGIPPALVPKKQAIPLPCPAGSAVIFDPLTPHASLPNNSDRYRWSFDIRYNRTGDPTGRAQFPDFVARSRARPDTVLTDADAWRDMWLGARARLSRQDPVALHRWDSSSPVCA
ncbi:MAG: phytanoyl-CoA dioxygenase family protein [Pseudomonadota bacterium]